MNERSQTKTVIQTLEAPAAIGPYSQAIRVGSSLYCSGQIALNPKTGLIEEGPIGVQLTRVFENLKAVCFAAGMTLINCVKLNIFLSNLPNDYLAANELMLKYFDPPYPARSVVGVSHLPRSVLVMVEGMFMDFSAEYAVNTVEKKS